MIADSQTASALLAYICQHPAEDDARLALADVLEERGEDARAEFIRLQCELDRRCFDGWTPTEADVAAMQPLLAREQGLLTAHALSWFAAIELDGWHAIAEVTNADGSCHHGGWTDGDQYILADLCRGFPAEVTLTAEALAGGPCGRCRGQGVVTRGPAVPSHRECPACRGTGKTPGHARTLFRGAPIEKVTLSDREPIQLVGGGQQGHWFWLRRDFPNDLWPLLQPSGGNVVSEAVETHGEAVEQLVTAALLLGRRRGWPCPRCKGSGKQVADSPPFGEVAWPCPDCHGTGHTVTP
jgi:uncharacterized protein (TIGR02996 family)